MNTARAIVRLDEDGKLIQKYSSVPVAACLLERKEREVKEWVRNPQLIRERSRWMYEKDYLRVCDNEGSVKELAFNIYRKAPERKVAETKAKAPEPDAVIKRQNGEDEVRKRRRRHTGTIYTELHNRGRKHNNNADGNSVSMKRVKGVGMVLNYKYRWVAEITFNRKRYRCRSAYFNVVKDWLEEMINRFS